jgi:hypothetical protein
MGNKTLDRRIVEQTKTGEAQILFWQTLAFVEPILLATRLNKSV